MIFIYAFQTKTANSIWLYLERDYKYGAGAWSYAVFAEHGKVRQKFVHLAVPVASSSAFPSRPTLMFCDFYVTQYCRDFANYECSIGAFATQNKLERCRYLFIRNTPYSASIWERDEENLCVEIFTHGSHIVGLLCHTIILTKRQHFMRLYITGGSD